ncbi:MAG: SurA N-terminal domain-containing protein [Opitutales bacterium]
MFTLIQTILQKHHKVVFSILLAVIVVAFVFTIGNFSPVNRIPAGQQAGDTFYGIAPRSPEFQAIADMTSTSAQLNGLAFRTNEEFTNQVFARIALTYMANQLDIPEPTDAEIEEAVRALPAFADPETGTFDENRYTQFLDAAKAANENFGKRMRTVLAGDLRIAAVQQLATGPGFVVDNEVIEYYRLQGQTYDAIVAYIDPPAVQGPPSEQQLRQFYEENPDRFAPPTRLLLDYAVLNPADFETDLQLTEGQLRSYFRANEASFSDENEGTPAFESVRAEVETKMREEIARKELNGVAAELSAAVQSGALQPGTDAFKARMEELGMTVNSLPALTPELLNQGMRPVQTEEGAELADVERPLNDTPFEDRVGEFLRPLVQSIQNSRLAFTVPVDADSLALVIHRGNETYPPPTFEAINAEVAEAYTETTGRELLGNHANQVRQTLQARLAAGEDFEALAAELGLSISQFDGVSLSQAQGLQLGSPQLLTETPVNSVTPIQMDSDPITGEPVAKIIYVAAKNSPEFVADSPQVRTLRNSLMRRARDNSLSGFVMELFAEGAPQGFGSLGGG